MLYTLSTRLIIPVGFVKGCVVGGSVGGMGVVVGEGDGDAGVGVVGVDSSIGSWEG